MSNKQREEGELLRRVREHLNVLYPDLDTLAIASELINIMGIAPEAPRPIPHTSQWTEADTVLITYGNTIKTEGELPLVTLSRFLNRRLKDVISTVHILPFFRFSSDDGFSVIDYLSVNPSLGSWDQIKGIANDFKIMSDLVINHVSSESGWFKNFCKRIDPGKDYFIEPESGADYSAVVRPRNSPLFSTVRTADGDRAVWCTFSSDQVDLNFRNPQVLKEFIIILREYLSHGIWLFRMDAVPFLWKESSGPCVHLQQTHEIIKLLRTLLEHKVPEALVICECNVPNRENLTYFGNANEAHIIYNFSLPPLLVYTLLSGDCRHLKTWMMSMPPAQLGTTYLNFLASHDGIGLRPLDGLLSNEERDKLVLAAQTAGGKVTYRRAREGYDKPYELNISLYDLLQETFTKTEDALGFERFLSAHTIMLALEGIPAFYIQSLFASRNDVERYEHTRRNRSINRQIWQEDELEALLDNAESIHSRTFTEITRRIRLRRRQTAFHPNATQFTLHLGHEIFAFWRQSMDRRQSIFCINNISNQTQTLCLAEINLISTHSWCDLITGAPYLDIGQQLELAPYQTAWISNSEKIAN